MKTASSIPHIAVIRGGVNQRQRKRSLQSGANVYHTLRGTHDVSDIHLTPAGGFEKEGRKVNLGDVLLETDGVVFNTLKGAEAAHLQRNCRECGVAHTGNTHMRYGEADNLERKDMLRKSGVRTIPYWRLEHNYDAGDDALYGAILEELRYPVVASPLPDAFSVDAVVVESEEELLEVLEACFSLKAPVSVSDTYEGNLYATIVMESFRGETPYTFPAHELLHDHEAANAYSSSEASHQPSERTPADVSALAKTAFAGLHLRDLARVDILETPDGELYVLDVDPHPALDRHSLLSDVVGEVGATLEEVFTSVAKQAQERTGDE